MSSPPGHEEFEIAIEKRLHGALGTEESARLDEHLAGCASCRRFEETARQSEQVLKENAKAGVEGVNWERLEAAMRRRIDHDRRWLVRYVIFVAMCLGMLAWVSHGDGKLLLIIGAMILGVGAFQRMVNATRNRARANALHDRSELLFQYRLDLERERDKAIVLRIVMPVVGIVMLAFAWQRGNPDPRVWLALWVCVAFMFGIAILMHRNLKLLRAALARFEKPARDP